MKELFNSCMGRFYILVMLVFFMMIFFVLREKWETSIISHYSSHLYQYKEAKDLIIDNLDKIKEEYNFPESESAQYVKGFYITSFSENSLDHSYLQSKGLGNLQAIKKLWDNKLITAKWGSITVRSDQTIEFYIKNYDHYESIFSNAYRHYIVYAPVQPPELHITDPGGEETLISSKELDKDWYYVVTERLLVD